MSTSNVSSKYENPKYFFSPSLNTMCTPPRCAAALVPSPSVAERPRPLPMLVSEHHFYHHLTSIVFITSLSTLKGATNNNLLDSYGAPAAAPVSIDTYGSPAAPPASINPRRPGLMMMMVMMMMVMMMMALCVFHPVQNMSQVIAGGSQSQYQAGSQRRVSVVRNHFL